MKRIIHYSVFVAGILLSLPASIFAQSDQVKAGASFNPKAPVPKNPSQMYIAQFVEYSVNLFRKHHIEGAITGLPYGYNYVMREWQQQDITDFAGCQQTFFVFEQLIGIANHAVERDPHGNFTAKATEAQHALDYLKPDCCKSWRGFCNMIGNAANATQSLRDKYREQDR